MLLIVCVLLVSACRRSVREEPDVNEEPLLLLESPELNTLSAPTGADNSRCHVCHLNFAMEDLSIKHAAVDIGCEQCHGPSDAHCADEDNITPPDRMFPRSGINDACLECHREKLPMTEKHKAVLVPTSKELCTHCHGEHRLSHRTRMWNRQTGELLSDDKVRMMTDEMLGTD